MCINYVRHNRIIWSQQLNEAFSDCIIECLNWDQVPPIGHEVNLDNSYLFYQDERLIGLGYIDGEEISLCINRAVFRRQGYSLRVMDSLLEIARSQGLEAVFGVVENSNANPESILRLLSHYTTVFYPFEESTTWGLEACIRYLTQPRRERYSIIARITL